MNLLCDVCGTRVASVPGLPGLPGLYEAMEGVVILCRRCKPLLVALVAQPER